MRNTFFLLLFLIFQAVSPTSARAETSPSQPSLFEPLVFEGKSALLDTDNLDSLAMRMLFDGILQKNLDLQQPVLHIDFSEGKAQPGHLIDQVSEKILSTPRGKRFCAELGNLPKNLEIYFGVSSQAANKLTDLCTEEPKQVFSSRKTKAVRKNHHVIYRPDLDSHFLDSWTQYNSENGFEESRNIYQSEGETDIAQLYTNVFEHNDNKWPTSTNNTLIFLNEKNANLMQILKVLVHEAAISADGLYQSGDALLWWPAFNENFYVKENGQRLRPEESRFQLGVLYHPEVKFAFSQIRAFHVEMEVIRELALSVEDQKKALQEYEQLGFTPAHSCIERANKVFQVSKKAQEFFRPVTLYSLIFSPAPELPEEGLDALSAYTVVDRHSGQETSLCDYLSTPQITTYDNSSAFGPRPRAGGDH